MENFVHETLTIEVSERDDPPRVELRWRGTSRAREPARVLTPFLSGAIARAAERGVALEMRFGELEFFNSATVMALIKTIHLAAGKAPVRFLYSASVDWQRLSFDPMRVFMKGDGAFELVALDAGSPS